MKTSRWIPLLLITLMFAVSSIWWAPRVGASKLPLRSVDVGGKLGRRYADIYKEQDRTKLIKHSHQFHAETGADCESCHASIQTSTRSSDNNLGKMTQCYECHDQKKTECSVCHVEPGEPYSSFENPKRELVFDHQEHVGELKIACVTCHVDIAKKDYTNVRTLPPMETCTGCHNGTKASDQCEACHTDIRFIRPADHDAGFVRTHKRIVASSSDANCLMCHTQSSCQECHEGGQISRMKKANEWEASRGSSALGTGSGQIGQNVHALDYMVTHRFDFKAKTQDCQSCHEAETFCVTCHSGSGKATRPAWHNVAGFVGTGGGFHASLAKKDMESCVICHASAQEDVTCLQCHTTKGGLK